MKYFIYLVVYILITSLSTQDSLSADSKVALNPEQPFMLENNRIVPGKRLQCLVDKKVFNQKKQIIVSMELLYSYPHISVDKKTIVHKVHKLPIDDFYLKTMDGDVYLYVQLPGWDHLKHIKSQNGVKGYVTPYDADLLIRYRDKNQEDQATRLHLKLPDPFWAGVWGTCVLLLIFVLIGLLKPEAISKVGDVFEKDESKADWENTNKLKRLLLYPLNFAVTPLGRYSISLTQILFWTFVTIFGLVYVYYISGDFLVITPQVLMLLGIGGGTALGAKMNTRSNVLDIPSYYLKFVTKKRIPELRDIISINGQPNIFKFQMLAFTLITGCFVIVDIVKKYAFPEIPENMITMMGISSLIYLGNEVTIKSVWDQIKDRKKELDAYEPFKNLPDKTKKEIEALAAKDSEFNRMLEEMKRLLNSIYSG